MDQLETITYQGTELSERQRQLLCQVLEEEMSTPAPLKQVSMSSEEENAVRYASGFVPMRLMQKYKNIKAAQFVDCLSHMALSSSDEDEESSYYEYTKTWIDIVNRGGLFCVNEKTFLFFSICGIKNTVCSTATPQKFICIKEELYSQRVDKEDVKFQWSMSLDIQVEDHSMELLKTIVEEWVKLRGFAVTSLWLEEYKHFTKETIRAKKGLRKELQKK